VILVWEVEETAGNSSSTAMERIRFKPREKVRVYELLQGMEGAYSVSFGQSVVFPTMNHELWRTPVGNKSRWIESTQTSNQSLSDS
jgi:hypothetical protein